jgi:hypothetical protein
VIVEATQLVSLVLSIDLRSGYINAAFHNEKGQEPYHAVPTPSAVLPVVPLSSICGNYSDYYFPTVLCWALAAFSIS